MGRQASLIYLNIGHDIRQKAWELHSGLEGVSAVSTELVQETIALKEIAVRQVQVFVALQEMLASELHHHATENSALAALVELLAGQEDLAAELEAAEAALPPPPLPTRVDLLRKQREAHPADDSVWTHQYCTDLVKVTSDRDSVIEAKDSAEHVLATIAAERDAAVAARDAAATERDMAIMSQDAAAAAERDAAVVVRDANITAKDPAITECGAADVQNESTHCTLLDMTSAKDSAVREKDSLVTHRAATPWGTSPQEQHTTTASAWETVKKKDQALALRDEAWRVISDVVAEKDTVIAAKDGALAAKEKVEAERGATIPAMEPETSFNATRAEMDMSRPHVEWEAAHKRAQKKVQELTKANDNGLMNDNAALKGEMANLNIHISCNNFKNLNNPNMKRMKMVWQDRDQ
ncbi:hypothetical protein V8D89_009464 [Ganoderma adspersum]